MSRTTRPRRRLLAALAVLSGLGLVAASSAVADTSLYHEQYRPQFHFTPAQNWMNDPNGLIWYKGQYHLFFQYNPSGNTWGNMSWGHAVSSDLVHWKQLPLAIPQDDNEMVFSGSVVLDKNNSTGFGTKTNPPLVAVYTSQQKATGKQEQALAYSTDGGTTWTKYSGNPVLDIDSANFRDPKVFWYAPTKSWLMAVALSDQRKVAFYSSPDLKKWTHLSDFGPAGATGGVWECPDLFPLPVDGNPKKTKWVLVVGTQSIAGGTGTQYFTGDFDGTRFTSDDPSGYTAPSGTTLNGFESGSYGDWTTTGTAFGSAPAPGTLPDQQSVSGYQGTGLVNSYNGGDGSTGTLTSPDFTVDKRYMNFLVGGGNHPHIDGAGDGSAPPGQVFADFSGDTYGDGWTATGSFANSGPTTESLPGQLGPKTLDTYNPDGDPGTGTITSPTFTITSKYIDLQTAMGRHPNDQPDPTAVNLIVDGKVVATATGANSADLNWNSWDTSAYLGKQAQIQVVDQNSGGWGHIAVGDIVFSDQPAAPLDNQTAVNLLVDGKVVRTATGSNSETLDWNSWDLRDLIGKTAQIQVVDHNKGGWGHILADDFTLADDPARNSLQRAHWIDYGADFYASGTFNDAPDGRRVMLAWMNNWNYAQAIPTSPWRSADTFPRQLALKTFDGRVRLVQQPVGELSTLRGRETDIGATTVKDATTPLTVSGGTLELQADLTADTAARFGLDVRTGGKQRTRIGYDTATGEVYLDRTASGQVDFDPSFPGVHRAPLALKDGRLRLHVLVDDSSVEVYADNGHGGQVVLTDQIFPDPSNTGVDAFAEDGTATLSHLRAWRLNSIWKK
ncbi:glycoside hydrolase family 32 protein [Streptomyces mirabilis]|uniref:glycoside hydrolase family 32 protein n=1 Tax=Streptomyces mirabilis TaxID=68239 RepID=UPI000765CA34|nr:glycoside hydrolase family 32 protein [Streptomyces mirabilis]MCX4428411.1 GH32 C-terminal domain-containing protein [Streptomyces mirabilis]